MVSGYQSREFGLGLDDLLSNEVREIINSKRKNTQYQSKDYAIIINCNENKKKHYQ